MGVSGEEAFFLAGWVPAASFSFDFFTILPVVVVGVFFGLERDAGLSTCQGADVSDLAAEIVKVIKHRFITHGVSLFSFVRGGLWL